MPDADIRDSGALELTASTIARAFASAAVETDSPMIRMLLTPEMLAHIGRMLIRAGELVYAIQTTGGRLRLIEAASWDIQGRYLPDS